jgi:hypothetical protein
MFGPWQILGSTTAKPSPFTTPEFLWATAGLVGFLLLAAFALVWAKRWRARLLEGDGQLPTDRLASYRAMYEKGEISREEYEKITGALAPPRAEGPPSPGPPEAPRL